MSFGVATLRAVVHVGDKTSGDARSWYMISDDAKYVMIKICLHMHDPREPHFSALKWILRYVRGTFNLGLQLFSSSTTDLVAYSDADWAGCPTTRRLTFGYWSLSCGKNLTLLVF
ncbi:ribonuclease H-like domain-containing protein [Tanacetum coccineum]|uniref:Ribonuclease H-like domain-containing protein n=1 Tax=Tanacetum coccineum TaxID=301880 RepID=A0ABQ5FGT4_9ASTR